jgi:hypothetical protein
MDIGKRPTDQYWLGYYSKWAVESDGKFLGMRALLAFSKTVAVFCVQLIERNLVLVLDL